MSRFRNRVDVYWLGSVPYLRAWDLQRALVAQVQAGERPDSLLLLEHPHVFTLGRRATPDHLLWHEAQRRARGVELVACDRGGDVTYHGPGQLVGYPILDLNRHGGDIHVYLRRLEESLMAFLARHGIAAGRVEGRTGVWCGDVKVAAIGVKLTGSVLSHGFALNLTTDLGYFTGIVPCGIPDKGVGSVASVGGPQLDTQAAAREYATDFAQVYGTRINWSRVSQLPSVIHIDDARSHPARRLPVLST